MASPRAIRIPRSTGAPAPQESSSATPVTAPAATDASTPSDATVDRRRNQAATERAYRLAAIYLGTLLALYAIFVVLDRTGPGGSSAAVETGLISFTAIAAAIGAAGALIAITPAPRAIELRPASFVVVEWWGHRRTFPPIDELQVTVLRRFPASFLSSRPVESVELGSRATGRKIYQFEAGILPARRERPLSIDAESDALTRGDPRVRSPPA
ncbi:MAG: hypothetical protein WB947_03385 [Thermoplasmata archaeon]